MLEPRTPYGRLARVVLSRPRATALLVLLFSLLGVLASLRLRVDSNVIDLLPPDLPSTRALHQLVEDEAYVATLSITVSGGTAEQRDDYLRGLAARLEQLPEVRYTFHELDPELAWRVGVLQLSVQELSEIRDRLKGALALGPAVTNPFVAQRLLALGPLTERLQAAGENARLDLGGGDMSRLIVRPEGQATDLPFVRRLMAEVYRVLDEDPPEAHGLELEWVGGSYRHNVEDYEGILQDVTRTSLAAVILVLLVVGLAFRDPWAVLLVFGPLVVSNTWTLGFAALTVRSLNSFTSFFSAVLLGLGIGFAVHLLNRTREERARGVGLDEAIIRAWDRAGPPCFTAAITSAFGFIALFLARFRGFRQLGLLLGVGVMLCLLAVMVVLPLLLRWRERRATPRPFRLRPPRRQRPPTYRFAPVGLLLGLLVTLVAGFQLRKLSFQYDLSELRRSGLAFNDLDQVKQDLDRETYVPLVVTFPDQDSLLHWYLKVQDDIAAGRLPELRRALSIYTVLPPDQEQRLAIVREIRDLARDPNFRYLPPQVQKNLAQLSDVPLEPLTVEDLPEQLLDLVGGDTGKPRMLLFASGNMWDLRQAAALSHAMRDYFPSDVQMAGNYLCLGDLYELVRSDAPKVIGMALVLVFLATLAHMRNLGRALGAVGALLAGLVWSGGVIATLGIKLSIVNIIGIPILLGVGVDVCIHLLHRLREEGPGRILYALSTTGWAAALATATAVVSFAALTFAGTQGVRSLGQLVTAGLTTTTLAAFVLIPLGWASVWKVKGDLPAEPGEGEDG